MLAGNRVPLPRLAGLGDGLAGMRLQAPRSAARMVAGGSSRAVCGSGSGRAAAGWAGW